MAELDKVSLADAVNETEIFYLALIRQMAEIAANIQKDSAEWESLQTRRPARSSLDNISLYLLQTAEKHPAYFHPQDLIDEDIGLVEVEEGLKILAALGFVRQVQVGGQILYRPVNPTKERAFLEGLKV